MSFLLILEVLTQIASTKVQFVSMWHFPFTKEILCILLFV